MTFEHGKEGCWGWGMGAGRGKTALQTGETQGEGARKELSN